MPILLTTGLLILINAAIGMSLFAMGQASLPPTAGPLAFLMSFYCIGALFFWSLNTILFARMLSDRPSGWSVSALAAAALAGVSYQIGPMAGPEVVSLVLAACVLGAGTLGCAQRDVPA